MGTHSVFIQFLINRMIFDKTSPELLRHDLDLYSAEIDNSSDRQSLYTDIIKLKDNRNIDIYYKSSLIRLFEYVEVKLANERVVKSWEGLHNDLKGNRISNASLNTFNEVMKYKRLPNGANKIIWHTEKAEAVDFQKEFNFTMKQFNDCFEHVDGKAFAGNQRQRTKRKEDFLSIIEKYKKQ
jgi:hypothetical protein